MGTTTKITIVVLAMLALTISVHAQSVPPPLSEKDIENALRADRKPASAPLTVWQKADAACRDYVQWSLKAPDSAEFQGNDNVRWSGNVGCHHNQCTGSRFDVSTMLYATNSYGGRILSRFDCTVVCKEGAECNVTYLRER